MSEFVRLDPHVIDEIVAICDTTLDELRSARRITDVLAIGHNFGDFESSKQLAAGYAQKGAGTPESARERVEQFIEAEFDWVRKLQAIDVDT